MRQQIAAGNWKMNNTLDESVNLVNQLIDKGCPDDVITIFGVPAPYLYEINKLVADHSNFFVAAQNCHQNLSGAFTGETSVNMLKSIGVKYVILGHSERREYFHEDDTLLLAKAKTVLDNGLLPIFCCGEPLEIRKSGNHVDYVASQLNNSILTLTPEEMSKIIIAYEPIWAIGTGETASPEQAQEMHLAIRKLIASKYDQTLADGISILYGGSVKASNAEEIFLKPDVDGGLVGGASLSAAEFTQIIHAF
jgi:triosephosphate isomerase